MKLSELYPPGKWPQAANLKVGEVYEQAETGAKRKLLSIYKSRGKKHVSYEVVVANPSPTINRQTVTVGAVRHMLYHAFLNWKK